MADLVRVRVHSARSPADPYAANTRRRIGRTEGKPLNTVSIFIPSMVTLLGRERLLPLTLRQIEDDLEGAG